MTLIRRKSVAAALLLAFAMGLGPGPALAVPGHAPPARVRFSAEEKAALARIDAYLNGMKQVQGGFVQLGPQGQLDRGTIYMVRPGKIRFSYLPPNPILVVSDGNAVAVANSRLGTVDSYPLSATPLDMLLSDKVRLGRSDAVLKVLIEPGLITVKARTSQNRRVSNVSFVFAAPVIELRQWTVTDDQGLTTTVAVNGLHAVADLPPDLFRLPRKSDFEKRPRKP